MNDQSSKIPRFNRQENAFEFLSFKIFFEVENGESSFNIFDFQYEKYKIIEETLKKVLESIENP